MVVAAAGHGLTVGQVVGGPRGDTVTRAAAGSQVVATPVLGTGASRALGFALGPPAARPGTVLYRESALGNLSAPRQAGSAPFHEVQVVLYASPTVDPAQVLVTTTPAPPAPGVGAVPAVRGRGQPLAARCRRRAPPGRLHRRRRAVGGTRPRPARIGAGRLRRRPGRPAGATPPSVLYRSEHRVAETLQRSLLPGLPAIAGLDVASRYVAGQADQQVGVTGSTCSRSPPAGSAS